VGVAIAASGALRIEDYGHSTSLVFVAQYVMPRALFFVFIIGGPIMALLTTLTSSFAFNSITIGQSCMDGWLPKKFATKNNRGSYKFILTFIYILGLIPIVLRFNITTITNQIQLVGSVLNFLYLFAYVQLPRKYPDAWKNARLHIPDGAFYCVVGVSCMLNLIIFWKSCLSINSTIVAVSVSALVLSVILGFWRAKTGNINIRTSVWADDTDAETVTVMEAVK
jgi:APA family basic amino acid/polyamine antiporter